ncbi:uncharacterized protein EV420DRAFT_1628289 [Desarmillaria tabescens]|uniref:Uncharacterized protein n=1 Tax=Armillaria tabescens TaxID=1929756 RepID=A0AA39NA44_ARMTA|nr:uncharacterized protein EV420DRAFT_1628289 [Desarmillaria tabescens]KAK0461851.1 hypothetical protein EV420DRAFT_1628289 [Desarmillaria tabescens]
MQVPLVSVNLATVALESFLYGIFFVLDLTSITLLFVRRSRRSPNTVVSVMQRPMFIGAVGLFITITAHWICTVIRLFDAFVTFEDGKQPLEFYANLSHITEVVKTGFLMASLVIGDSMIIYRLWVVWGFNYYVIIFPLLTLAGLTGICCKIPLRDNDFIQMIVCGIGITYQFTQYFPGLDVFASEAGRWITCDCIFTLLTNIYSSTMIAWYIWNTHRKSATAVGGTSLMSVLAMFIESATIYTSWTIFFTASYQSKSNLQFTAVDNWPEVAGIAFSLINKAGPSYSSAGSSMFRSNARGGSTPAAEIPLRPLTINISQAMVKDTDEDQNPSEDAGRKSGVKESEMHV